MMEHPHVALEGWLNARLDAKQTAWLSSRLHLAADDTAERKLSISLGLVQRRLPGDALALSEADQARALAVRSGWDTRHWTLVDAARILLLIQAGKVIPERFSSFLQDFCRTADTGELISVYRGIAFYPSSESLEWQVAEGLRTNMRSVFEAIAHHNPYPAEHFTEHAWNHMVLKALFIESRLSPIQGLDRRANAQLAEILCHYAHERWAAHRQVTPELWRCVGPFAQAPMLPDLARAARSERAAERQAGLLALHSCEQPAAQSQKAALAACFPETWQDIGSGKLSWSSIHSQD